MVIAYRLTITEPLRPLITTGDLVVSVDHDWCSYPDDVKLRWF
jgi:hypothetical protein